MTAEQAKAHLLPEAGEGSYGYVSSGDVQDALDVVYTDMDAVAAPANITKADVGLGNVDNTSDMNKPVSTAQATAIAAVSGGTATPELGFYFISDYGAVEGGGTNCSPAINAAADAAVAAGGGVVVIPVGEWGIRDPLPQKSYVHFVGRDYAFRYWGYSTSETPSACKLTVMTGFTGSSVFPVAQNVTAFSISNLTVYGNRANMGGTVVHGVDFAATTGTEQNGQFERLGIFSMSGDGIRGQTYATRWSRLNVGGCAGWGINANLRFTDTYFNQSYIHGNVTGGLSMNGTSQSGLCSFDQVRFERNGFNSAAMTSPPNANAPGIYLRTCNDIQFIGCETDANTGNGVDIAVAAGGGGNIYNISFIGGKIRRDGSGTATGADPGEFAAIKLAGVSGTSLTQVEFIGVSTSYGHLTDGGTAVPSYFHPKYGIWSQYTDQCRFIGGRIDVHSTGTKLYAGGANFSDRNPHIQILTPQLNLSTRSTGPTSERPATPILGCTFYDTTIGKPIWWNGSNWKSWLDTPATV